MQSANIENKIFFIIICFFETDFAYQITALSDRYTVKTLCCRITSDLTASFASVLPMSATNDLTSDSDGVAVFNYFTCIIYALPSTVVNTMSPFTTYGKVPINFLSVKV